MKDFKVIPWLGKVVLLFFLFFLNIIGGSNTQGMGNSQYLDKWIESQFEIDGTQLVQETRDYVAHHYNVAVILVSASYITYNLNGRYEYSFSVIGGNIGTVEWEIIGDDHEGFLYED